MINSFQHATKSLWGRLFPPAREQRRRGIVRDMDQFEIETSGTRLRNVRLLTEIAECDIASAIRRLESSENGLTEEQAAERLTRYGLNEVVHEQRAGWLRQLAHAYNNPFNLLLTALALVSYFTEDIKATIILSVMVALSSLLRFVQENRSTRAVEKLQQMVTTTATVKRVNDHAGEAVRYAEKVGLNVKTHTPEFREIPLKELVPGDLIRLSAGDMVPSDVRLLTAKDLFISQATLTGESFPAEKSAQKAANSSGNPLDLPNLCFMGTNVVSGSATAVVVNTGSDTFFGSLSRSIVGHRAPTEFDKGIHRVSWLLIRTMLVMVVIVFLINAVTKQDWTEAFLFAIAVAVGLTPEMLPMIVTATLARGAVAMSRHNVIVKRLNSIQNFGAMDVLCTDKTGTLTQDNIVLEKHVDLNGNESEDVLRHAFLNSHYQTGLKNLLDVAILKHAEVFHELGVAKNYRLVDEIPFDFVRRRMSVVVSEREEHHELICKGAVEEMLGVCTSVSLEGCVVTLDEALKAQALELTRRYNDDGFRVIAVAYRENPANGSAYSVPDEIGLTLLGFIAFLDPPKESAGPALKMLNAHGVSVKILTGDNDVVTRNVCRHVGIDAERVVLGPDIAQMTDPELAELANKVSVFAKLTPAQKERIVRALQSRGHVVGFLGDGINDSPALRTADIGISVDTAVDIAKESADIILLEKSLLVLEAGVIEGRRTFGNIVKYIKMAASSNFGNMFSVLGASALLPFLPMLPLQLLIQNLLYDISQTAIPFDDVDKEYTAKPRKWEIGGLARFMIFIGPISSIFDYATFAVMWFVFAAQTTQSQSLFQSGWFIEGLLSQTLIVHIIRTSKIPFVQSRAAVPLLFMTATIMAIGIYLPFSPIASAIGLRPLPVSYFGWLVAILLAYAVLTQVVKGWFIKRYGLN
jgi:Mg2+-importing ATPase